MNELLRPWPIVWLIISLIATFCSFVGGDTSIIAGWVFLVWTAPIGMIWWFMLYDFMPKGFQTELVQIGGELFSVAIAFIFWFILVPWIRHRGHD